MVSDVGLNGRTALVTGAAGFIGSTLCRSLRAAGATVHGVSRSTRSGDHCERWWRSDLSDLAEVRRILRAARPDLVFHLASHVTGGRAVDMVPTTFQANLTSAVNLLTAITEVGCARIILTGSLEEPDPRTEWPIPSSPYAAAKFAASTYGRMFHRLYEAPVVILRLFMVYGPAQADLKKLIPYVILSLLENRAPELSRGERRVDWIYVDDIVRAYIAAATASGIEGKTLEIGSGKLVTVREVVEQLTALVNPSIRPRFGSVPERPFEQERIADVETTEAVLDWRSSVELSEGLSRTVKWYSDRFRSGTLTIQASI